MEGMPKETAGEYIDKQLEIRQATEYKQELADAYNKDGEVGPTIMLAEQATRMEALRKARQRKQIGAELTDEEKALIASSEDIIYPEEEVEELEEEEEEQQEE